MAFGRRLLMVVNPLKVSEKGRKPTENLVGIVKMSIFAREETITI